MPQGKTVISSNQTFVIGLPSGGSAAGDAVHSHWERYSEVLRGAAPPHALRGHFWCREASADVPAARIARSLGDPAPWRQFYSAYRSKDVGFRPAMKLPEGHGAKTGDILHRFTLTMDGRVTYYNVRRKPARYRHGAALRLVDEYTDRRMLIPWVVVGGYAIAAEDLLVDISWDDLCAQGFVGGPSD